MVQRQTECFLMLWELRPMLKSIQLILSQVNDLKRFKGRYFLVGCLQKHSKRGEPYWEICLSDSTATVKVYCFDQMHFFSSFKANSFVHIEVCAKSHQGKTHLRCVYLEEIAQDKLINNLDIRSLPSALCPFPALLIDLVDLFQTIDNVHLKRFISQTLLQRDIATRYINCPTRARRKQTIDNCLLAKTLLVAKKLLKNTNLDIVHRDLAIAFAIVHEVGKVNKFASDSTLSAIGMKKDINDLSLATCNSALQELAKVSPVLHYQMRYLLTYGFAGKHARFNVNSFYSCLDYLSEWRPNQQSVLTVFKGTIASRANEVLSQ